MTLCFCPDISNASDMRPACVSGTTCKSLEPKRARPQDKAQNGGARSGPGGRNASPKEGTSALLQQ
eukprot:CAMPEP_0206544740 /NCGR_PEP_ID=MMETSP0325_2-20121206/11719_1 /ASSEMBLY_ACC=CAM_ASM_000347 /TAXON_ID=2866 /ORGANISM="Crypthecodinium cohnii, Strain Seligo" /LENGTH=65 /DNA_ID=CAMNT_0054043589 /DNA_START=639 /DNA_END=836 /DNA_ORIENTATION=+